MRKLLWILIFAAGCASPQPPAVNVHDGRGYCALCREWHDEAQMKWPIEYKGRTYRFCDPNCRAAFEKTPEKFLKDPRFNPGAGSEGQGDGR